MGGIDVLVNNAGIYTEHPVREVDYAEWRQSQWSAIPYTNWIGAANAKFPRRPAPRSDVAAGTSSTFRRAVPFAASRLLQPMAPARRA